MLYTDCLLKKKEYFIWLTSSNTVDLMKMIAKNCPVLKQDFAELAFPCFVSVACFVQLPPFIFEAGDAAEVAGVAALYMTRLCLLVLCRGDIAKLGPCVLNQVQLGVLL